jgi:hypothetical protein
MWLQLKQLLQQTFNLFWGNPKEPASAGNTA